MSNKHYIINQIGDDLNLLIDGEIDEFWGVGLRRVADEISQSGASNVMVQINSPGGSVTEGNAIAAFIKGHPSNINTTGLGLVASIATIILLAGKKVSLAKGSWFMIHNPTTFIGAGSEALRDAANLLDKIQNDLADTYVAAITKNGKLIDGDMEKTKKKVLKMMEDETWLSASEALDFGFIDTVVEGVQFLTKQNALQMFNSCKIFKNAPAEFVNKLENMINMSESKQDEVENKTIIEKIIDFFKSNPVQAAEIVNKANADAEAVRLAKIEEARQIAKDNGFLKEAVEPVAEVEKKIDLPQNNEEFETLKKQIKSLEERLGAPSTGGNSNAEVENKNKFFPTENHKIQAENLFKAMKNGR